MKHWVLRAGLLAALTALAACESLRAREPSVEREIEAANRVLEERFRAGDVLGVADLYADDALLIGPSGLRIEGREEIDAYWSEFARPVDWRLEVQDVGGSAELAWELGTSHMTQESDGAAHTSVVDLLFLWRRAPDGTWRIAFHAYWYGP